MVDLDQCTHATINGCDKERRGWYPLPSSLSSSIYLPSCPARCPLPNCFSLTLVHLHLNWHLPGGRPSADAGVLLMAGVPDTLCAASIRLPWPAPWENSELSFYQAYHEITASSPPRPPSSTYLTFSFSPTLALPVSHMLISHGCTHSLQPYRELSASDLLCSPWMHRLPCSCHPLMTQPRTHLFIPPLDIATEYFVLFSVTISDGVLMGRWGHWRE